MRLMRYHFSNPQYNIYGAQEETRTLNPKDMDLNHARIPIPPQTRYAKRLMVELVGFEPTQTYWHCHSFTASLSLQGMQTHEDVEFLSGRLVRILSTVSE